MPTANRRRWMRDYMNEYRQGKLWGDVTEHHPRPDRREKLKEAHRLDSFRWRLSKLLGPQYEIFLCIQYEIDYSEFEPDGTLFMHDKKYYNDINMTLGDLLGLEEIFSRLCDIGSSELFKVFELKKYRMGFDQHTDCMVVVLDKAALLEDLQQLPGQGGSKWEKVLSKVKTEAGQGTWQKLDFSKNYWLWLDNYTMCYSRKWTVRDRPEWTSSVLYSCLHEWVLGSRIGQEERYEWPRAFEKRLIISKILLSEMDESFREMIKNFPNYLDGMFKSIREQINNFPNSFE